MISRTTIVHYQANLRTEDLHVGDTVRVKSLEWYNQNKRPQGKWNVVLSEKHPTGVPFLDPMAKYCGQQFVISRIDDNDEIFLDGISPAFYADWLEKDD